MMAMLAVLMLSRVRKATNARLMLAVPKNMNSAVMRQQPLLLPIRNSRSFCKTNKLVMEEEKARESIQESIEKERLNRRKRMRREEEEGEMRVGR